MQSLTRRLRHFSLRLAGTLALTSAFFGSAQAVELVGLNFSGAGFASQVLPGMNNRNYIFPSEQHFKDWSAKGIKLVRFPIIWERIQPKLNSMLDPDYGALVTQTLNYAQKYGVQVILDLHNYARYRGEVIGAGKVTYFNYWDVMYRLAFRFGKHPALYGYDIMNEPHDAVAFWPTAAQHGINGIRTVDNVHPIIVEGNGWSSASRWPQWNDPLLALKDPADKLIFSAHVYFDNDGGGQYASKDMSGFDPMVGVNRVKPFVDWLKKNGKQGYIGEFGVPDDDPRWLLAMDNMLAYLKQNCIPASYWAAGPGWGNYNLAVEPVNGVDRPQWATLKKYVDNTSCVRIGPN
ncbi:glycoside hydrolase family 5 protein [Pseudomonas sp. EpS/L25]|uniref:glycoside hydrolase family 5 protein n=1 Tax=Pseudomonas sp. EpS/L25 TaxID=1749078 RepID=UPI0007432C2D|nr:glycoside hydrolase family 5 protein [Pseudomonas sp. EpS/L25]KUM39700.1 endoglucanase [Pseudomonas sp. EpS/L25]